MKRTIRNLLQHADQKSIEEMASLSHMTDDATKERIFREVQKRTAPANHFAPAETETYHAKPDHSIDWSRLVSAAAACVTIVGTTAGCLYLMQHKPNPIQPGMSVEQPLESETTFMSVELTEDRSFPAISLSEANQQETPWKHHVIQMETIGSMKLDRAFRSDPVDAATGEVYERLELIYRDPALPEGHGIAIEYTLEPAEQFAEKPIPGNALKIELIDSDYFLQCDNSTAFVVDYGEYRVHVNTDNMTDAELNQLVILIKAGCESDYTLSLSEANEQDMPWKHHMLQAESISGLSLKSVTRAKDTIYETYPEVRLAYTDQEDEQTSTHKVFIGYTTAPVYPDYHIEDLLGEMEGADAVDLPNVQNFYNVQETGQYGFVSDCGEYRIVVNSQGLTEAELQELLGCIKAGVEANAPVILTLDEANAMDKPWQGKVLQTQQISNMTLEEVYTGQLTYQEDGNTYDELYLHYKDSTVKGYHDMTLTYLEKTEDTKKLYPDSQSPDMLADAKIGMPYQSGRGYIFHQSGDTSFSVDFGDYFVIVRGRGCTVDEVREIADLLQAQGQDEPETAQLTDTGEEKDAQE